MSVTLNTRTIVLLVATLGILVGFAVSQIAFSQAGPRAIVVKDPVLTKQVKKLNTNVLDQSERIDSQTGRLEAVLDEIQEDTHNTCRMIANQPASCY